jgi:tripartite-type tricarboxylate transporter receptor subunit TctC
MFSRRHWLTTLTASSLAALFAGGAHAQEGKPTLRIVVPYAAGGATDALARLLAPRLSRELAQNVVVENRAGASGQIGTAAVKAAAPDGNTFLLSIDHAVVVVPLITPTAGYDAMKDFTPVGQVARFQWTFAVPVTSPAKTLTEFVDYARAHPQDANYGVPLQGGVPAIIGTAIDRKAGIQLQPVPFSGSAAVMPQLIGGQIAAGVTGEAEGVAMARGGKLRILAVSGTSRSALLPDVPTFEELGFSGVNVNSFTAFFAPKGLPPPMAERFNAALRKVLADDALKARIADMPMHLAPTDLEGARRELTASYAFWNDPRRSSP